MGFYTTYGASKQDIVKECIEDSPRHQASEWSNAEQKNVQMDYDVECKTLHHRLIGNVLWTVQEIIRYKPNINPNWGWKPESQKFIGCYVLSKGDGEWGYKPMDEGMGPYYYSCPLKYLALVPEANKEWREKVRVWHACYSRKLVVGKTYTLKNCRIPQIQVTSLKPLRGVYDGHTFSLQKNLIGEEAS